MLRDGEDGAGTGGVRQRSRGVAGDLGVHSLLQRGASSFVAGLRQPDGVRGTTGCPEIAEWTVRGT